jgi:hypothetical protein
MLQRLVKQFDNHILSASELGYWLRRANKKVSLSQRMSRVLVGTITILSVMLFVYELIAVQLNIDIWQQIQLRSPRDLTPLLIFVGITLVLWAFMLPYQRARILAQQVVARDKTNKLIWEMIVLTGVDARTYVRAKWWTITRMVAPQFLPSAIIRASVVAFVVGELSRASTAVSALRYPVLGVYLDSPTVLDILLLGVLTVLLTYLSIPRMIAGNLDTMLDFPRHGNTWGNWTLRGGVSCLEFVVTLLVPLTIFSLMVVTQSDWRILLLVGMVLWTAIDNGLVITGQLALYALRGMGDNYFLPPNAGLVILVLGLALPIIAARTWWTLMLLERTAQRHQLVAAKDAVST